MSVVYPDVTAAVRSALSEALRARDEPFARKANVGITYHEKAPGYAVAVRAPGGPRLGTVTKLFRVAWNVWAPSEAEAADLAALVEALATRVLLVTHGGPAHALQNITGPDDVPDASGPHKLGGAELIVKGAPL